MSVGDNIKAIRKEKKITQTTLANDMGISRSYLSDLENNRRNPSTKTLESLAEKLDVSTFYLLEGRHLNEEDLKNIKSIGQHIEQLISDSSDYANELLNGIDFNNLSLQERLFLGSSLTFLNTYPDNVLSNFIGIFNVLNETIDLMHDETISNVEKEKIIDDDLNDLKDSMETILENIKESLYKEMQDNK